MIVIAYPVWCNLLSERYYLWSVQYELIMGKVATAKPHTKTVARYSRVGPFSSSETLNQPGSPTSTEEATLRKRRLPDRIKVLTVQVPVGNPYDIGIEQTLKALRRSGVLTKSGKLGKTFR